jgi:transketolase
MVFDQQIVEQKAADMRRDILKMITLAGSGHPGGSLSATDIVATLFFGNVLRYRANDPGWEGRDRFILSKGHVAPVLYAALAHAGYFEVSELATLRKFGSRLQGHPDSRKLPGVEVSSGSLGQGLSIASGLAYGLAAGSAAGFAPPAAAPAAARDGAPDSTAAPAAPSRVYVLLGDGELQEGQVWEAAMFAAHRRLGNLIAIVDNNNLQIDGALDEVVGLGDIAAKFAAFGWHTLKTDGHSVAALKRCFDAAAAHREGPAAIIASTVKGKGVSFMENECGWHGKAPSDELCDNALRELAAAQDKDKAHGGAEVD